MSGRRSSKASENFNTSNRPASALPLAFKAPKEEEVFIARETEKQKKKQAKEQAKGLKIWDKPTASNRVPLKRYKDKDIKPADIEENVFNYNQQQRGYISAAMHIAKSRVNLPKA